jgi:2,3-bisphosphoglycerate-dependent phosphoglycerate mutase
MKIIYLIRHGKASLDGTDRNRGLTEEGIEHANQISKILINTKPKIQKIYSSPLNRAILTIEPLAKSLELEIKIIEDLKEKITGDTSGKNLNDEKRKMWDDFDSKLPDGESSSEASKRALSALNLIKNELSEENCAAVQSHGTLIALILHHFDPLFGFHEWKSMTMPDIYKISFTDDNAKVEHIGCDSIETFKIGDK